MHFDPASDIPDLSGKVILVTGGTSGIGRATVLALASHNPEHIYFTGRNPQAGLEAIETAKRNKQKCAMTFIHCDLSASRDEIRRAICNSFKHSHLDILILNAGIMAVPPGLTEEGLEVQFGTNYFGHAILLRLLLPTILNTSAESTGADVRLVVLSSFGHTMHPPGGIQFENLKAADCGTPWQRYGQSKLADILLAKSMAKRYPRITSVSVHPGLVKTSLSDRSEKSFLLSMLKSLWWTPLFKGPEEGSHNTLWAATTPKEKLVNGGYYEPVGKVPGPAARASGMAEICSHEALADRLWEWTERELGGFKL
jgi:NAD(P)-dependent dehydrogenase (short-subunit alcohol dehydrogenase family)